MSIHFDLSPEQEQLVAAVRKVLADLFPLSRLHGARGEPVDAAMLGEVAALGWLALGVADEHGGAGCGVVEEALLCRELGRNVVSPSVLAAILAVHAALDGGRLDVAAAIAEGRERVSLATIGGSDILLYDMEGAVRALIAGPSGLALVDMNALASATPSACLDKTVSLHRAALPSPVDFVGGEALGLRADLLIAACLLGLAEGALTTAVSYAGTRHQFGQPIGAFQAIKHRCADMKVRATVLGAQVAMAALAVDAGSADAALQVASAKLLAGRIALQNAAAGIQIHGGMGFTAECDAHLFLLRAHLLKTVGTPDGVLEARIAEAPLPDFASQPTGASR